MLSSIGSTNAGDSQTGSRRSSDGKGIHANPTLLSGSGSPRVNFELFEVQTDGADGIVALLDGVFAGSSRSHGRRVISISIQRKHFKKSFTSVIPFTYWI